MQRCRLNHPEVKLLSIKTILVYTAVCFHGHTPNVDISKYTYNNILLLSTKSSLRVFSISPSFIQPFSIRSESFTKRYLKLALIGRIIYKLSDYYLQSLKEILPCNKQSITLNASTKYIKENWYGFSMIVQSLRSVCFLVQRNLSRMFLSEGENVSGGYFFFLLCRV